MHVAAEIFSVRFVCGFGSELADGVIPLDDVFDATPRAPAASRRNAVPPQDVAVVTFDATAQGIVPVAHTHAALVAAGNAIVAEAALTPGGATLGALATSSFAGLGSLVMPWLITGGRLALHQPFSPEAFLAQLNDEHCETAVVPAAILAPKPSRCTIGHGVLRCTEIGPPTPDSCNAVEWVCPACRAFNDELNRMGEAMGGRSYATRQAWSFYCIDILGRRFPIDDRERMKSQMHLKYSKGSRQA